jgi:hypothetical protein
VRTPMRPIEDSSLATDSLLYPEVPTSSVVLAPVCTLTQR